MERNKGLKTLFLLAALVCLGLVVASFWVSSNRTIPSADAPDEPKPQQGSLVVGRIDQTAVQDGIKQWRLEAASGYLQEDRKRAVFQQVKVTFFLEKDQRAYLTADRGTLLTDSNNIEVSGHVVLQNEQYRLESEALQYDSRQKRLTTDVPVRIASARYELRADAMTVDLETNRAVFDGNVRGIFDEAFQF